MKYFFLTTILLLFRDLSSAQNKKVYDWGCSFALNSIQAQIPTPILTRTGNITTGGGSAIIDADGNIIAFGIKNDNTFSLSLIPKIYIKKNILFRFEFGITNLKLSAKYDEKSGISHDLSNKEIETKIFRYNPGFQWFFLQEKRIESYCAFNLTFSDYKELHVNIYQETRELNSDIIQSWLKKTEKTPGGYGIGVGALAGFSLYITKNFSIGAELSSSGCYYNYGGVSRGENQEQVPPNPIKTYSTNFSNSYTGFKISKLLTSFNLSVRL